MKCLSLLTLLACAALTLSCAQNPTSWTFVRGGEGGQPRGGTTRGAKVEYDEATPKAWKRLQAAGPSRYERDRRAIYAMEGVFKAKFEFIETILMDTQKEADRPYASWGTEFVKVIEDTGDFISLQHIMVMSFVGKDGTVHGPYVMKHWRQDWQWQGKERLLYEGERTWSMQKVPPKRAKGGWVWTVWHVDDSPRYSGIGRWSHFESASIFETETMSRPLPRRERSVRSDYKVLMGQDTLLITPTAWYHEQKNFKHREKLRAGSFQGKFLAREIGHNSYKRIVNFDIAKGEKYWSDSKDYWKSVRTVWQEIFARKGRITLKKKQSDSQSLFAQHFAQSEDPDVLSMNAAERKKLIRKTIGEYIVPAGRR